MPEKEKVKVSSAYTLLHPMHTVLVSCIGKTGKPKRAPIKHLSHLCIEKGHRE